MFATVKIYLVLSSFQICENAVTTMALYRTMDTNFQHVVSVMYVFRKKCVVHDDFCIVCTVERHDINWRRGWDPATGLLVLSGYSGRVR